MRHVAGTPATGRAALAATASVLVALALTGCGSDEGNLHGSMKGGRSTPGTSAAPATSPAVGATDHDQADVDFALQMVPHHLQAVEMADLVPARSGDEQLRALATRIKQAQQPEVEQLTSLLAAWGVAPDSGMSDADHMDPGATGMLTDDQLRALGALRGDDFRAEWLRLMIAHHTGALAMARTQLDTGTDPATRALATSVLTSQQQEIDEMRAMLTR